MNRLYRREVFVAWSLAIGLGACGDRNSSSDPTPLSDAACTTADLTESQHQGLLFASVATDYSSSEIYFLDFQSGCLRLLLSGQSGDPLVRNLQGSTYLFNRSESDYNYQSLQLKGQAGLTEFQLGPQIASPVAGYGDPAAVSALASGDLLMIGRSEQVLRQINPATGTMVDQLKGQPWATDGQPFFPNDLLVQQAEGGYRAHILHGFYNPNGSQQSFVVDRFADGFQTLDLDSGADGIQGIRLSNSIPSQYLYKDRTHPLVVSVCTYYASDDCRQGVERLNLDTLMLASQVDFNLSLAGERTYSGAVEASVDGVGEDFFIRTSRADLSERQVVRVSDPFGTPNIKVIHTYAADNTGEASMFFDPSTELLFVGESYADGRGFLHIYWDENRLATLELEGIPYSGALVD